jgi:hypothetical protein
LFFVFWDRNKMNSGYCILLDYKYLVTILRFTQQKINKWLNKNRLKLIAIRDLIADVVVIEIGKSAWILGSVVEQSEAVTHKMFHNRVFHV